MSMSVTGEIYRSYYTDYSLKKVIYGKSLVPDFITLLIARVKRQEISFDEYIKKLKWYNRKLNEADMTVNDKIVSTAVRRSNRDQH